MPPAPTLLGPSIALVILATLAMASTVPPKTTARMVSIIVPAALPRVLTLVLGHSRVPATLDMLEMGLLAPVIVSFLQSLLEFLP